MLQAQQEQREAELDAEWKAYYDNEHKQSARIKRLVSILLMLHIAASFCGGFLDIVFNGGKDLGLAMLGGLFWSFIFLFLGWFAVVFLWFMASSWLNPPPE